MDAEEKKQDYAGWKPRKLSSEEERALLDSIKSRGEERKRAEGVLPQKIGDVKKQMDGMLPASDPETVNLMPGYFRERTSEEQAEYDQYKADKADFDNWTKTSPIAKSRLAFAEKADFNQIGRDKIQNELIETWRAEKGLRSFADMNNLDALQGKIDMLKRRASEKSGVLDRAKFSDFRPTQFGGVTSVHDVGEKQELGIIGKAESLYNDLSDIVSYAKEFKKRGGYGSSAGEFWKGFKDALSKLRTVDLGITDLFESNAYKEIVRKAHGGGELTDQEKAVLELDQLYKEVSSAFNPSKSYKGGYNTGVSLPFMAEFALNPVSGAGKSIAKAVGKSLVAKGAKEGAKGLSKFAAKVVNARRGELALRTMADVFVTAPAMAATTGMPRALAEANRRMTEDGDTPLSATLKAGTASWIEYMSEGLGGAVDVGLSKAGRLVFGNGMEKLAATAVGRKLSAMGKSSYAGAVRRMKGAANVQSFLSENIEEHIGNIVNHFTIGDVTKEDLLSLDTYLDTAIPIAVTQAAFGISSVGGYSLQVGRVSRAAKKAETALGQFMSPEERAKLAEKLRDMPLDAVTGLVKRQIQKAVENERQAAQTEDESLAAVYMQDAKKAKSAAAYVYAQTQKNILVGAKSQVDEEKEQSFTQERDKIKAEYIASMPAAENGSYRIVRLNGEGGEAVQVMTDISTYQVEERGDMITRFRAPDNAVFVMHEDGTKEQVRVEQLLFDKELPWVDNVDETATNLANMDASKFFEDLEAEREAEFESAQVETEKEGLRIENGEMAMMSQEDGSLVPVTIADTSMIDDGVVGIVMQDDSMDVVPVESLSAYEVPEESQPSESQPSESQPYTEEERALQEEAGIGGMEKSEGAQYDEALAEENADGLSFDDLEAPDAARMLRDQILDADGAIEFVEDEIKTAKKELTSIKRTKVKGATVEERARSFQERRNRIKDAEARISRLESIRSELSNMGMAEMERINNEEAILDVEAKTGEELAAMMLMSGTKLIYSDFKRHTGYGDKEARGMFGIFASAEKGGIGIERFGEILLEMDEDGRFFDHDNAMSAVDAILSLFQSVRKRGDLYKFISNNEQARREEEMKKSMSEEEYFIRQAFGMSMDEYSAYLRMFQDELLTADDYKELEEIIAEEYGKRTSDQGGDSEDTGDEQGRPGEPPVSDDELLRGERTGDESGAVRMEERGDTARERGGSDGTLQDEVKNDNFAEDGISERISQASDGADSGKADGGLQSADQLRRGIEEASRDARGGEKEVNRTIEALGQSLGLWIPFENLSSLGSPFVGGNENTNYLDENGTIYKVNNLMNSGTIVDLFNRIDLHNAIFPNTRYELVGVSGFGNGSSIYPVYKQYFVRDAEFATPEEIDSYMRSLGFEKTSKEAEYSNGEYVVSDLRPRNVLKDADGDIYVIDAGIEPVASVSDRIAEEREKVEPNPTEAQKEAGNYRKGHVKLDGFDITIETPKGGVRRGVAADGKEWSIEMQHDYGYIRGTKGKDGDHIDVFLSESPEEGTVFVVDQVKEDGSFDEHKVMYGFSDLEDAKAAYLSNYSDGWKGLGNITEVSKDDFKRWVESSTRKTKPFAEYVQIARKQESAVRSGETIESDVDIRFRLSEEDHIKRQAIADGTFMKAPNGNETNLNERQWLQVRTRAFKDWFGDWEKSPEDASKVVDENGEPMVVYHGTDADFTEFKFDKIGTHSTSIGYGFYLASSENVARGYTSTEKVMPLFLCSRKQLDVNKSSLTKKELTSLINKIIEKEIQESGIEDYKDSFLSNYADTYSLEKKRAISEAVGMIHESSATAVDQISELCNAVGDKRIVNEAVVQVLGYDAIIQKDFQGDGTAFVALTPNQIKSATDNVGAFDVDNPDIRFRRSDTPIRESDGNVFARGQISSTIPDGFASTHFAYEPNLAHIYEDPTAYFELERLAKENGGILPEGWEFDFSPEDFRLKNGYVCCKQSDNYEYPQYIMGAGEDSFCVFFEGEKVATIYNGVVAKVGKVLDVWERKGDEYVQVDSEDAKIINHERFRAPTAWDELLRRSPKLQMQQKIREEVGSLSKQLNVPVTFVFSRDLKGKKAQSKGWYDGKTGEVFIVIDKNVDVEDAVATVMHEVVAHKGLRDMLGRAEHDALMDEVFNVIPEDVISELKGFYWDDTKSEAHNRRVLADEYVALLAETYQAPSVIERIAAAVRAAFRKLGISLKMNDGDIMYMLYLSKNRLTNRDSSRTTIDKTDRLQTAKQFANEYDNIMFRMPIEDVENSLYEDYPIEVASYMRAKLSSRWYRWTEAHQDAMRSWKLFIDKLKDVKESENVYMMENIMGSRAADKVSRFEHDKMKPLETSIRKLKKSVKLNDEGFSLYLIAKHAPERNEYMRRKAVEKLERDRSGSLKDMSDEDFRLEVERAMKKDYSGEKAVERELKALGYDSLQAYTDHVENTAGSELINTLWDRLRAATGHSIKEWYDCGMMGREAYQEMKSRYQFYVPLRGHMGEVAKDIFRYYKAEVDPRFSDPNERAEGRKSIADNPLPYIRQMAHSAVIAGSKNLVKMCAYRLASSHKNDVLFIGTQYYDVRKDGDGSIIDYIPIYPDINADDSEEEMREKLMDFHGRTKRGLENGSIVKEAKGAQDMKLFATDQQVKEHICTLKINGRSFYLIAPMHPELTQSITGRNREVSDGAIIRRVAAVTNFMAKNYTSRSPNFMLSNFSRDVWWSIGSLFTREGTGYTMGFVRNIPLAFKELFKGRKNSVVLDEFYKSGAATGFVTVNKESRYKKDYRRRASDKIRHKVLRGAVHVFNVFEDFNAISENATRLAVFMTSRQEGRSLARSAYDAKEASVNFNRKGSGKMGAAQLKSFFAFYNAGVQGLDAYGKLWGANWKKMAALHGMAVFLGAAPYIVAALTGDDEMRKKYFALPEYVRRNNLVIPLWGDSFLKIPLPIEARAYHALGDVFGGLFRGEISSKQAALSTVSSMMDMFPINFFDAHGGIEKGAKLYELGDHAGALASTLGGVIPTAFRPLTEVVANMNYSGGKIYNESDWNAHLPAYRKAGYFTNPWMVEGAKALNKATGGDEVTPGRVNINPSIAEHYMMGYIGGVMTFVNQCAKTGISVFDGEDINWNQVPIFNRFFLRDKKILQKKIDRDFRDVSDDMKLIQKRESGYKKILKEGNWVEQGNAATKLDEMYESGSIDLSEAYKSAAEHIKKMRKYMEDLEDKGEKSQMEKEITDIKADFLEYKKSIDDGREEEKGKTA